MTSNMAASPRLSRPEQRVLELYDRLQELQLELALLRARQEHISGAALAADQPELDELQAHLLETKAVFALRNGVIESVMMVQPTLKAVHNATHASPIERDLLPCIQHREQTSIEAVKQHNSRRDTTERLTKLEVQSHRISRQNVQLAAEVQQLAESASKREMEPVDNNYLKSEIASLEQEVKTSRQRWKVIKGTASAVVAGSGIDWVRDKRLREMALDSTQG